MDNNAVISAAQFIASLGLIYLTKKLADSTKKYAEDVEKQTILLSRNVELMDKETKLHEYENRKDTLIRKRDRLVNEMDSLVGPLYGILDDEYFDLKILATTDRYAYIPPPQAGRDFIFNKKAYDILDFWEKVKQNMYLCRYKEMADSLNFFFQQIDRFKSNKEEREKIEAWLVGFKREIKTKIEHRNSVLNEEITKSENELEALG
jgi:hypothetical protein